MGSRLYLLTYERITARVPGFTDEIADANLGDRQGLEAGQGYKAYRCDLLTSGALSPGRLCLLEGCGARTPLSLTCLLGISKLHRFRKICKAFPGFRGRDGLLRVYETPPVAASGGEDRVCSPVPPACGALTLQDLPPLTHGVVSAAVKRPSRPVIRLMSLSSIPGQDLVKREKPSCWSPFLICKLSKV